MKDRKAKQELKNAQRGCHGWSDFEIKISYIGKYKKRFVAALDCLGFFQKYNQYGVGRHTKSAYLLQIP